MVASAAWALRLAEVEAPLKKRPSTGWRKEWKTTWAPLQDEKRLVSKIVLHPIRSTKGKRAAHLVWGRAIQRTRANLKM